MSITDTGFVHGTPGKNKHKSVYKARDKIGAFPILTLLLCLAAFQHQIKFPHLQGFIYFGRDTEDTVGDRLRRFHPCRHGGDFYFFLAFTSSAAVSSFFPRVKTPVASIVSISA